MNVPWFMWLTDGLLTTEAWVISPANLCKIHEGPRISGHSYSSERFCLPLLVLFHQWSIFYLFLILLSSVGEEGKAWEYLNEVVHIQMCRNIGRNCISTLLSSQIF